MSGPGVDCFYAERAGQTACTVHCMMWPCDKAGRPASTTPVHTGDSGFTRAELIEHWRAVTGGLRPLLIHHGDLSDGAHLIDLHDTCWCGPQRLDPDPVSI